MPFPQPMRQGGGVLDNVIPKIFYEDVSVGIDLFVDGIGMEVLHRDDMEAIQAEISARRPDLLHPNLPEVTLREWNAREFAVRDPTSVCVVFRSWA
jgi:hypothetical protein